MNLVDWLVARQPGTIAAIDDRIEIAHDSGEHSIFWLRKHDLPFWMHGDVREFYEMYDGADLFSSTFKIASLRDKKKSGNVNVLFSMDEIQAEVQGEFVLPGPTSAFMYQAGIGIYCASHLSSRIFECDTETGSVTEYGSMVSIIQEWLDAVA